MGSYVVRPMAAGDLRALVDYLEDQLRDNGADGGPVFQPLPRGAAWRKDEKVEQFRTSITVPLGAAGWRRFWVAEADGGDIAGHVDLRAHPEPCSEHRALLGMGVHRDHRRRGIGRSLLRLALDWGWREAHLAWVDLEVLGDNHPARALYRQEGFEEVGFVRDMFRVDGVSVDQVVMSKQLRPAT